MDQEKTYLTKLVGFTALFAVQRYFKPGQATLTWIATGAAAGLSLATRQDEKVTTTALALFAASYLGTTATDICRAFSLLNRAFNYSHRLKYWILLADVQRVTRLIGLSMSHAVFVTLFARDFYRGNPQTKGQSGAVGSLIRWLVWDGIGSGEYVHGARLRLIGTLGSNRDEWLSNRELRLAICNQFSPEIFHQWAFPILFELDEEQLIALITETEPVYLRLDWLCQHLKANGQLGLIHPVVTGWEEAMTELEGWNRNQFDRDLDSCDTLEKFQALQSQWQKIKGAVSSLPAIRSACSQLTDSLMTTYDLEKLEEINTRLSQLRFDDSLADIETKMFGLRGKFQPAKQESAQAERPSDKAKDFIWQTVIGREKITRFNKLLFDKEEPDFEEIQERLEQLGLGTRRDFQTEGLFDGLMDGFAIKQPTHREVEAFKADRFLSKFQAYVEGRRGRRVDIGNMTHRLWRATSPILFWSAKAFSTALIAYTFPKAFVAGMVLALIPSRYRIWGGNATDYIRFSNQIQLNVNSILQRETINVAYVTYVIRMTPGWNNLTWYQQLGHLIRFLPFPSQIMGEEPIGRLNETYRNSNFFAQWQQIDDLLQLAGDHTINRSLSHGKSLDFRAGIGAVAFGYGVVNMVWNSTG